MSPGEVRQIIQSAEGSRTFNPYTQDYNSYTMDPMVKFCILKILEMIEDIYRRLG